MKKFGELSLEEKMDVFKACLEGKKVEWCSPNMFTRGKWSDKTNLSFSDEHYYRIKPQPREFWVNEYNNGGRGIMYIDEIIAREAGTVHKNYLRTIHLIEVLDE